MLYAISDGRQRRRIAKLKHNKRSVTYFGGEYFSYDNPWDRAQAQREGRDVYSDENQRQTVEYGADIDVLIDGQKTECNACGTQCHQNCRDQQ